MQYGVNRGGDCCAEFLLKIYIKDCQVSRVLKNGVQRSFKVNHFTLTGKPINYFMSPYSNFSLSSKRSKDICARNYKITRFCHHTVVWRPIARQPPRVSSSTLYRLKVDSVGYIFCRWWYTSIFFQIFVAGSERRTIDVAQYTFWPFKVIGGRWFSCHLKGLMDFLLVINSNLSSISHRFWDTTSYRLKIANFPYPTSVQPEIWKCSLCTRSLKFCVLSAKTLG